MPFWLSGKTVNKDEFRVIKSRLKNKSFSDRDIETVEQIFVGDMLEGGSNQNIDKKEFQRVLKWLEENKSKHDLSSDQIEELKEEFSKYL